MNPLIILANKYPNEFDKNINVFTQQTAWTFSDLGYECVVVCPSAVNLAARNWKLPLETEEMTGCGNSVRVVRPRYISMGQRPGPLNKARVSFTVNHYVHATMKTVAEYGFSPSAFLGEFLCPCGVAAARMGELLHIPSFFQHGEALYLGDEYFGNERLSKRLLSNLTGVVAVSQQNRSYLLEAGVVSDDRICVLPNGCRTDRFYRRDRTEARKRFGWPDDAFVVGMVGSFDERKGVMRLKEAVESIDGVFYACAGKGPLDPSGEKCLHSSPVNNSELPFFLSALDAFVLPTLNEGCCTAVSEAICCGLPIISSDRSFNYDICDASNSLLVDPTDIEALATSIARLRDDCALRNHLAEGSARKAAGLDLRQRIQQMVEFMDGMTDGALQGARRIAHDERSV